MILESKTTEQWVNVLSNLTKMVRMQESNAKRTVLIEEFNAFVTALEIASEKCSALHEELVEAGYFDDFLAGFSGNGTMNSTQNKICELVKKGRANKEIANELNITVQTVKNYLTKIYVSYGVTNRTELAVALCKESN